MDVEFTQMNKLKKRNKRDCLMDVEFTQITVS